MSIEPSVSRAVQSPLFTNFADPTKRSAKTTVMVKDGQTIAIGGLLKTDEEDSERKVPGLSRILFIGNLFQSKAKQNVNTELIVFITAHSIMDVADINRMAETRASDDLRGESSSKSYDDYDREPMDDREAEIRKTVMKLRKKRDLDR